MKTSQLKTHLHESIENINDEKLLITLKEISSHHYSIAEEPKLDNYQVNRLKESREQITGGNFFSNEQADELIVKWLKK